MFNTIPFIVIILRKVLELSIVQMQIFIKTLSGRKQQFNFDPEQKVLAVKQALQEKEGTSNWTEQEINVNSNITLRRHSS